MEPLNKDIILIGVIAKKNEKSIVQEFFSLFKTPWEFYTDGVHYDVIICSGDFRKELKSQLIVIYSAEKERFDTFLEIDSLAQCVPAELNWRGISFPIYTKMSSFMREITVDLKSKTGKASAVKTNRNQCTIVRIGYDLFQEVGFLLSSKQPVQYATVPTLEVHIAILRDLMIEAGVHFIEIPPVPFGYDFITCLTHDIDFAGIRNHKFDHTMFGFLYRAIWSTFRDALKGKAPWLKWWNNLKAALTLPVVYLGIAKDFWAGFDKYLEVEKGLKSTFFFLPYKGKFGDGILKSVQRKRAGKYDIEDLQKQISAILSKGCEIGLHGIDAWHDTEKAKYESNRIVSVIKRPIYGTRIHWLYFDNESPKVLEKTGLNYDSTCGYNEAVGFRAGTAQVFQPIEAKDFFELPLLIQDTALFYPKRMNLTEEDAFILCKNVIDTISTFGGVLVINWHDRSLAPERSWNIFYQKLLNEIKSRKIWSGTANEVVQWFRKRRLVRFGHFDINKGIARIRLDGLEKTDGPDLRLRVYGSSEKVSTLDSSKKRFSEMAIRTNKKFEIPIGQL